MKFRAICKVIIWCALPLVIGWGVYMLLFNRNFVLDICGINLNDVKTVAEDMRDYMAYVISFAAYALSVIVYFYIDSLKEISSMEGNVLEDAEYKISYEKMVYDYRDAKDIHEFRKEILKGLKKTSKIKSSRDCAEALQQVIDNILWFSYAVKDKAHEKDGAPQPNDSGTEEKNKTDKEKYVKDRNGYLKVIKKKVLFYGKLGANIKNTLGENYNLIDNVFKYQNWVKNVEKKEETENILPKLENINTGALKNPVAKTVYYDYLGLEYFRRARNEVEQIYSAMIDQARKEAEKAVKTQETTVKVDNLKKDTTNETIPEKYQEFEHKTMKYMKNNRREPEELFGCKILLERAIECFKLAQEYEKNNLLWKGYTSYNIVRVRILYYLLFKDIDAKKDCLNKKMNEVIEIRKKVKYLFNQGGSYLDTCFRVELDDAINLKQELEDALNP